MTVKRQATGLMTAIWVGAALAVSGCSHGTAPETAETTTASSSQSPTDQPPGPPLPAAEALTDVLQRLADPAVPGADKTALIADSKPADATTLDRFGTALKDGGYLPLHFETTDIGWSDRDPGNVVATVKVTTSNPDTSGFTFPMEFVAHDGGWQLSHKTAELLLAFGKSRVATSARPAMPIQPTSVPAAPVEPAPTQSIRPTP